MGNVQVSNALAAVAVVLAVALFGPGCRGTTPGVSDARIFGQVVKSENGEPYRALAIALLNEEKVRIVATVEPDENGFYEFTGVARGTYVVVVYDEARQLFHTARASYRVEPGDELELDLPMMAGFNLNDLSLRLVGRVVDFETEEPIEGVVVESTHLGEGTLTLFSEIRGHSSALTDVTDAEGRFLLFPASVLETAEGVLVPHLRAAKTGYRGGFEGPWERNRIPQLITVRLQRGEDDGVVTGRITTLEGAPKAGVPVALEWRRFAFNFPKDGLVFGPRVGQLWPGATPRTDARLAKQAFPGAVGVSDADGFFRIEGLPVGGYVADPSYPRGDGWTGEQLQNVAIDRAGQVANIGVLRVTPAVIPLGPTDGMELKPWQLRFDWNPVRGAQQYLVEIVRFDGWTHFYPTNNTFYDPNPLGFDDVGNYRWNLIATKELGFEVGRTERERAFTITENDVQQAAGGESLKGFWNPPTGYSP